MNFNTRLMTSLFVIGSVLVPVAAHAADGDTDRTHPERFVKDSLITTKVKAKLAAENLKSLANIQVDTDHRGVVVLSGTVDSQDAADRAISIARRTEGVTVITSKLKVVEGDKDKDKKDSP